MAKCPRCGTEVTARFCPNCGADAQIAAAQQQPMMAPPPPPYGHYAPPAYGQAPPYGQFEKPRPVWQGVVTLILMLLVSAFVVLGIYGVEADGLATAKIGAYFIAAVAGVIGLPFGIWALVSGRTSAKVMAAIGMIAWVLALVAAALR